MKDLYIIQHEVTACIDEGLDLTNWEISFLMDMADRLEHGRPLTAGQEEKLEEIYCNKVK